MNLRQLLCNHDWQPKGMPSYYCSIFSVFAQSGSLVHDTYLVKWWGQCSKCEKEHLFKWFVHGDNKDKELCFCCRLYVSTQKRMARKEYTQFIKDVSILVPISVCDNCGQETFNEDRNHENWLMAVDESLRVTGNELKQALEELE